MSKVRYARFWKCALQVNPWDYARKYRGADHGLDEAGYNAQVLQICQSEDISVVGIADHGCVNTLDALHQVLVNGGITVFPGFEIASSEKAHFVCLFPESTTVQQLERYLGSLKLTDPEDGVRPSSLSAEQLLEEVIRRLGGIVYAAHCTERSGVLQRQLNHVWKNPLLQAAQIPDALDELKNDDGNAYRLTLLNKNPDYRRLRPIGIINARDVAEPKDLRLPQACCLVRMTEPSFDAFKQAFLDPESRVRLLSDREERFFSRLERVRFTGGYLPGVDIRLSEHLNAIIGGRGTGKTTLLECIRYALEQEPIGERAKRTHREIVKQNLGAGRVEIDIRSFAMQGRKFAISRRYGEAAVVRDESGNTSTFKPADLLPRLEIFGQNEIFDIAQDEGGLTRLLRRFISSQDGTDQQRTEIRDKLRDNAKRLIDARARLADVEDQVARLPRLEEQAQQFQDIGLGKKLAAVPKLEKEKQLASCIEEEQRNVKEVLASLKDLLPDAAFLGEEAIKGLPHADEFRGIREHLKTLHAELEILMTNAGQTMDSANTAINARLAALRRDIVEDEAALEQEFAKIPALQGRSGREIGLAYQQVLKDIERIRPLKSNRDTRLKLVDELRRERENLLANLSKAVADMAAEIDLELKSLRRKLAGKVKPYVDHAANRKTLKDFLLACSLEGVGEARLRWVDDAEDFSPLRLAQTIRRGSEALKNAGWGITPGVAEALAKLPESKLLELEAMELPDTIRLELNVAHEDKEDYRPIGKLSTGQQCTAVLHLLLLDNRDPLIVDQPEDNLDNAFIAERIVSELRTAKLGRQFIFATHNANIPVFGDAEWIGVLQSGEDQASMPDDFQGAVDVPEIRRQAAVILEGVLGLVAFDRQCIADFLQHITRDTALPQSETEWCRRLSALGFMTDAPGGEPVCTMAGVLLFGLAPRRFLRQAGVRIMIFEGREKTYDARYDRVLDSPILPLWTTSSEGGRVRSGDGLLDMVDAVLTPYVREESDEINAGFRREATPRFSREVIREVLLNAVAHRNWTRFADIELVVYADRLEVTSPGPLPNTMTIEKMIAGQRSPRNPLIVDILRDYGYVDARGMGIRNKVIPLVRQMTGRDPIFEETDDYLRTIVPAAGAAR